MDELIRFYKRKKLKVTVSKSKVVGFVTVKKHSKALQLG